MATDSAKPGFTPGARIAFIIFLIAFGIYTLNVLIGKANILYGWGAFQLGNVLEFLIFLVASIAFVTAALLMEAASKSANGSNQNLGEHHE